MSRSKCSNRKASHVTSQPLIKKQDVDKEKSFLCLSCTKCQISYNVIYSFGDLVMVSFKLTNNAKISILEVRPTGIHVDMH